MEKPPYFEDFRETYASVEKDSLVESWYLECLRYEEYLAKQAL